MVILISRSPEETAALGEQWGRAALPSWVIGLSGELGAGKTQLVKGLARGLGITARVHSPTFTLLNEYSGGRLVLFHIDLYRLETEEQIISAGLEEFFYRPPGLAVIEWAERWPAFRRPSVGIGAAHFLSVQIETRSESQRQISYESFGH